jgi:hypothetical protein
MASVTVATPSVSTPSATSRVTKRVGNSELYQGQGHMDSITVPATVKRRTSRNPSKQSSRQSVRCNLGGAHSPLVIGADRAISGTQYDADVIALGLRSRAHNSCGNALAIGMAALAEISGNANSACAFGVAPKAVAHCDDGNAIAFGFGPEAAALGRRGVAVAIADGEENAIVSAGPQGRLVIVMLSFGVPGRSVTFEREIDGREFRPGRRYTIDDDGFWSEVEDGYANMDDIKGFEYPTSQVATA